MSDAARNLTDAEAKPWTAERQPDLTGEHFAMYRAAMSLAEAMSAMRAHDGPKSGAEWGGKIAAYTQARDSFLDVFNGIKGDN